jgi:hypothetical protein
LHDKAVEGARQRFKAAQRDLGQVYGEEAACHKLGVSERFPSPRDADGKVIKPDTVTVFYASRSAPGHLRSLVKLARNWRNDSYANYQRKLVARWGAAWLTGAVAMGQTVYETVNPIEPEDAGDDERLWGAQRKVIGRAGGSYLVIHTLKGGQASRHVFATTPFKTAEGDETPALQDPISTLEETAHWLQPLGAIWTNGPSPQAMAAAAVTGKIARARGREAFTTSADWRIPKAEPTGKWLTLGRGDLNSEPQAAEVEATCAIHGVETWEAPVEEVQALDPEVILRARHFKLPDFWDADLGSRFLLEELGVLVFPRQQEHWEALFLAPVAAGGAGREP